MRRLAGLVIGLLLLSACNTTGFVYRIDTSIEIVQPEARSTVEGLPVTVRWTDERSTSGFRVAPSDPTAEYYAVFIDRTAMRPGQDLVSLLPDDQKGACEGQPDCPDAGRLRDLGVILTDRPQVQLDFLADLRPSTKSSDKDPHEVTIVRMRGDRRVGEAAFPVTFFLRR
jgi:hypothetical protein